jgi:hypothetical protein
VGARGAVLDPPDVEHGAVEVDLIPAQVADLGRPRWRDHAQVRFCHVKPKHSRGFGRWRVADNKMGVRFPALIGLVVGVVVLALLLYFSRGSLATFQLGKEQASFWDIIVKFVGGLVAIVGAFVAISKTLEERAKANQAT